MQTLDEQTEATLLDAKLLCDLAQANTVSHAQRNFEAIQSMLAARYYERQLLPPWERELYDISFSGSDSWGTKYFVTDRESGLQLHGPFSWAVAYMRTAVEDPAGTASNHSTFCRCGADDACTWSRINSGKEGRQLGRSDDWDAEAGEYRPSVWGEDDD